jgi:hypothetical protein
MPSAAAAATMVAAAAIKAEPMDATAAPVAVAVKAEQPEAAAPVAVTVKSEQPEAAAPVAVAVKAEQPEAPSAVAVKAQQPEAAAPAAVAVKPEEVEAAAEGSEDEHEASWDQLLYDALHASAPPSSFACSGRLDDKTPWLCPKITIQGNLLMLVGATCSQNRLFSVSSGCRCMCDSVST